MPTEWKSTFNLLFSPQPLREYLLLFQAHPRASLCVENQALPIPTQETDCYQASTESPVLLEEIFVVLRPMCDAEAER